MPKAKSAVKKAWGGSRKGAGAKPKLNGGAGGQTVAFVLGKSDVAFIEEWKKRNDCSNRSEALRQIIGVARAAGAPAKKK